jgi:hypothetical protein
MATYTVMPFQCDGCYQAIIASDVDGHGEAWASKLGFFIRFLYSFLVQMRNADEDEFLDAIIAWVCMVLCEEEITNVKVTVRHPSGEVKRPLVTLLQTAGYSGNITHISDELLELISRLIARRFESYPNEE